MRKLLYICEQYVPPARNGSELVYLSCLKALSQEFDVYALMFGDPASVGQQTRDVLSKLCSAHLIVPGVQRSTALKLVRTLARALTGHLMAPRYLEEMNRSETYSQIHRFIAANDPDVMYVHKYDCVARFGRKVVTSFSGPKIIDIHDDFVAREKWERRSLKTLLNRYPALKAYAPYKRVRLKHRLSRFSERGSRRQELALLSLFDWVLAASAEEAKLYAKFLPERVLYCPWPISPSARALQTRRPVFSAGFIASDAVANLEGLMAFVEQELPVVRRHDSSFTLAVAGGISESFRLAYPVHEQAGISILGNINDLAEFYASVSRVIVPLLHGTGVSLKTLEAASFGVSVIATPVGVRGIPPEIIPPHVHKMELVEFHRALRLPPAPVSVAHSNDDETRRYLTRVAALCDDVRR